MVVDKHLEIVMFGWVDVGFEAGDVECFLRIKNVA